MKRKGRDTYVLSTGREIKANHGIIGIARPYGESPEDTFAAFEVCEGYTSHLAEIGEPESGTDRNGLTPFTAAERVELADFMIAEWQDLRRHAAAAIGPPRRVTSSALDLERGIVHLSLDCGHETEFHLADPVLAVTEAFALPKVGDERPCQHCRDARGAR